MNDPDLPPNDDDDDNDEFIKKSAKTSNETRYIIF